ncbi:MAG: site-2 protease family protein [Chloroflexota bacterium]|nr:site-2 protease family protein [Chloroflexota bacterium]
MINENASFAEDRAAIRLPQIFEPNSKTSLTDDLRQSVERVMMIEREPQDDPDVIARRDNLLMLTPDTRLTASFEGRLLKDSQEAYHELDEAFKAYNHTPYFRMVEDKHVIHAMRGRVQPRKRGWVVPLVLFIITFFSLLQVGAGIAISEIAADDLRTAEQLANNLLGELWRGLPYALSLLLILGAHELGHYFAARYHKISVSLPYFIPLPFIGFFGTMGAFIRIDEPFKNRKAMLDVGAAGPLMGLVFAIPIVIIGLATSQVREITPGGVAEGNSLLYALAKVITFGRFLPDNGVDVYINQLAFAGWAGLLVTSLNLIPLGQLDGGHIVFSLFGNAVRKLYFPLLVVVGGLVLVSSMWLLWLVLLFMFGQLYAAPLDMITPLDKRRRWIAWLGVVLLIVTFVPIPLSESIASTGPRLPLSGESVMLIIGMVLWRGWKARK